jgi:GT2 family glycosyltransferase
LHSQENINAIAGRIVQKNMNYTWEPISTVAAIDCQTGETNGNFDLDYNGNVLFATGGHMSIKRSVFQSAGLFNRRFSGNALYEDVEFFCRMRKKGFTVRYNPRATVFHYPLEAGGCHTSKGPRYLMERLHNQTLFFLLHISLFPPMTYIKYCRNLIEYISRNKNKTYSIKRFLLCILTLCKAYYNAILSMLYIPKLRIK